MRNDYDVIVIGGGHAGAEAAWAAANALRRSGGRAGRVAMVTMDPSRTGQMSCNPAIGGLAKGQLVREIDALGGLMGLAIDATGIQFRVLNQSKGPAVRGPRAQADKHAYAKEVQRLLATRDNLHIIGGTVDELLVEDGRCVGIAYSPRLAGGNATHSEAATLPPASRGLYAKATVLTTGTFMRGFMHRGPDTTVGGRIDEPAATGISANLAALGFELGRLKTGTPPRLAAESLDLDALQLQPGDAQPIPFSDMTHSGGWGSLRTPSRAEYERVADRFPVLDQHPCWITTTNESIHDLIRANLDRAPMYNGQIDTAGPRYCPSIEDKVVRFADKPSHTVFLEPESLSTNEVYCNGISTSLPTDVQERIVRMMPGCERAEILRHGYAVEYDMVIPHQIDATCMTKRYAGLFLAGQINGTTGYEEAAAQGLLAGLNAARLASGISGGGGDLVRLRRDQAYIGVMMDDLVTKVPREPYRMFTSRAEHRLLLRADNSTERLTPIGRELGLVDDDRWAMYETRRRALRETRAALDAVCGLATVRSPRFNESDAAALLSTHVDPRVVTAVLSEVKYAPFIERHERDMQRLAELESHALPTDCDFADVPGLRNEARHVLVKFRPATLGQAGRLAGINPADVTVLAMALTRRG